MSDKDNPFVFVNWEDSALSARISHGPFSNVDVEASNAELPDLRTISKDLHLDLALPTLTDVPVCELEEISDLSSDEPDGLLADSSGDHSPWTLPAIARERPLESYDVSLHLPTHTEFPEGLGMNLGTFDLTQRASNGVLVVFPNVLIKCACYMAHGEVSPLFWTKTGSTFEALDDGRFQVQELNDNAIQKLLTGCKAMGEKRLRLDQALTKYLQDDNVTRTGVAIASTVRTLLEADDSRVSQELKLEKGFRWLQDSLRYSDSLLNMLCHLQKAADAEHDAMQLLRTITRKLAEYGRAQRDFEQTIRAILLSIATPALEDLMSALRLRPRSDAESVYEAVFAFEDSATDQRSNACIVTEDEREQLRAILDSLDLLSAARPTHTLVASHATLIDLDASCLYQPDPDAIVQKARAYEQRLAEALDTAVATNHELGGTSAPSSAPNQSTDVKAGFMELGGRMTGISPCKRTALFDHLSTALKADLTESPDARNSPVLDQSLLAPLQPIFDVQYRLVTEAVLREVLFEQKLLLHLDVQRQFHLFGNGVFLQRLQAALFNSSSSSPRDRLKVEGNFGLRMDGRSSRWPPASSDLQLTLAGLLRDSYVDPLPSSQSSKDLPGGLSFAIRSLSENEIASVMDPSSPHALDFLRLQYQAPKALAAFLMPDVLDKYDDVFRFLLSLIRQSHLTKTLVHLLTTRPRSGAHAFAQMGHYVITTLTTHFMDLGISAPWLDFTDAIMDAEDALAEKQALPSIQSLVALHESTLDDIQGALFLTTSTENLSKVVQDIFVTVLRAAAVLTTSTQSLAVDTPELRSDIRDLNVQLRAAVADLIAGLSTHDTDYHRMLAQSLSVGPFAADEDMWCAL